MITIFFEALTSLIKPIWEFLGNYPFLLLAVTVSLVLKASLLTLFALKGLRSSRLSIPLILLLIVLIGGIIEDVSWVITLIDSIFISTINPKFKLFFVRVAWGFFSLRYLSLALFIECLSKKNSRLKLHQILFLIISLLFFVFFIGLALIQVNNLSRLALELKAIEFAAKYALIPLMFTSLILTTWKLQLVKIPRIIKKQLKILIRFLILPTLIAEIIQVYPFVFLSAAANNYPVVGISTITLTCAIYYSMRKVMGLRFLNLYEHVKNPKGFNFMKDFKNVLEEFSHVTSDRELIHITQNFFKNAFNIPLRSTHLYIRNLGSIEQNEQIIPINSDEKMVENFISAHNSQKKVESFLKKQKIVITDELSFNNFYEKNDTRETILNFLGNVNADIFIPVYDKKILVAYIIVERYAKYKEFKKNNNNEFYSNIDRDQMVVFATYLGNIIHLLNNRNLNTLIAQEKELQEELYDKHQKINQYKESIRSFLRTNKERKIGIIFYKNRKFSFGNKTAHDLINININTHEGHPITKALKKSARHALEYKLQQTAIVQDKNGNKLILLAIPNIEQNNVIITIYYPEISDILKKRIELLSDPTKWDYLLYLETTKSGKLIDQLIPGNGENLLNFKINLLKIALSKKAILLDMPDEDLLPTVELLHHISLKEKIHTVDLQGPSKNFEVAIKLFGINPIFNLDDGNDQPLLKKLNNNGTLFIKNIHFLCIETQKHLSEFLKYGMYRIFKSDKKDKSNVRIICSTDKNIQSMVSNGTFSKELFNELNKTQLIMPSLITLPESELKNLATGFSEQAIKTEEFKNLLELNDNDKKKLANTRPSSLQELKTRVEKLLYKKSKKNEIYEETQFNPSYSYSDPELIKATKLGKHALKDPKIMEMLWNKFKNQNKIATLLSVNRSSVNRRCKKYKLIP